MVQRHPCKDGCDEHPRRADGRALYGAVQGALVRAPDVQHQDLPACQRVAGRQAQEHGQRVARDVSHVRLQGGDRTGLRPAADVAAAAPLQWACLLGGLLLVGLQAALQDSHIRAAQPCGRLQGGGRCSSVALQEDQQPASAHAARQGPAAVGCLHHIPACAAAGPASATRPAPGGAAPWACRGHRTGNPGGGLQAARQLRVTACPRIHQRERHRARLHLCSAPDRLGGCARLPAR